MSHGARSDASAQKNSGFPRSLLWLITISAGLGIANLYYNQPLLEQMTADLGGGAAAIGLAPMMAQTGYAIGMLFLIPLGDMIQRRKLVLIFTLLVAAASLGIASSRAPAMLLAVTFLAGLCNMTPQLLIPFAAEMTPPAEKGRVVGFILSGLFAAVLLSRTVSGFVGAQFGWRAMFVLAGVAMFIIAALLWRMLPASQPSYRGSYAGLLRSVWSLLAEQPVLREACLFGATLFAALMMFWSNLVHLMAGAPFHLGPRAVGAYGLLGAGAALASPIVGRISDRGSARAMAGLMVILTIGSFGLFWLGRTSLVWIGVGVLAMDLGVQLAHVCNQSRILDLREGAQSRIQTAYMSCYFAGGGIGAAIGSWAWQHGGWAGVCSGAAVLLLIPLTRWLLPAPRRVIPTS